VRGGYGGLWKMKLLGSPFRHPPIYIGMAEAALHGAAPSAPSNRPNRRQGSRQQADWRRDQASGTTARFHGEQSRVAWRNRQSTERIALLERVGAHSNPVAASMTVIDKPISWSAPLNMQRAAKELEGQSFPPPCAFVGDADTPDFATSRPARTYRRPSSHHDPTRARKSRLDDARASSSPQRPGRARVASMACGPYLSLQALVLSSPRMRVAVRPLMEKGTLWTAY